MAILDLAFHPFAYVTINELAEYWRLRRRRVLDHIKAGRVEAIEIGPGLYRVRTVTALAFEQDCAVPSRGVGATHAGWNQPKPSATDLGLRTPRALRGRSRAAGDDRQFDRLDERA